MQSALLSSTSFVVRLFVIGGLALTACGGDTDTSATPDGGNPNGSGSSDSGGDGNVSPDAAVPRNVDFEWSAWPVPPDNPTPANYVTSGSVVTDSVTGLHWQQVASASQMTWTVADYTCHELSLSGTGWRLPTLIELESIVDYGAYNPSIETSAFPGTPTQRFWTGSGSGGAHWSVYFLWGYTGEMQDTDTAHVRCVRSPNIGITGSSGAPQGRFVINVDTVNDSETGLRWQRSVPASKTSWAAAGSYCQGLQLGGTGGWRLPTIKELQSLVNVRALNPAIDVTAFPSTASDFFFAATPYAYETTKPWVVSFSSGLSYPNSAAGTAYVRCVR